MDRRKKEKQFRQAWAVMAVVIIVSMLFFTVGLAF